MNKLLVILLCCLFSTVYAEGENGQGREDTRTYHLYDDIDLLSTLKFSYGRPRVTIKSVFPQLQTESEYDGVGNFNRLVLKIVAEEIENFKQAASQQSEGKKLNLFHIDYAASMITPKKHHVLSVRFSMHGKVNTQKNTIHYHRSMNYDLDDAKLLQLEDLFDQGIVPYETIAKTVKERIQRKMGRSDIDARGLEPLEENYQRWNLKSNGILFTFDGRQLGEHYKYGTQTILVPYVTLKPFLSKDSPLYYCVKGRKSCNKESLMTGGFIDEARVKFKYRALDPTLGSL